MSDVDRRGNGSPAGIARLILQEESYEPFWSEIVVDAVTPQHDLSLAISILAVNGSPSTFNHPSNKRIAERFVCDLRSRRFCKHCAYRA